MKEINNGRKHYFTCSNRSNSWPNHSGSLIPYDVDEDLSIRLFRGQSIEPEKASPAEACSRIIGCGSGKKGKHQCRESFPTIYRHMLNIISISSQERQQCLCRSDGEAPLRGSHLYICSSGRGGGADCYCRSKTSTPPYSPASTSHKGSYASSAAL
jgi:hypothetical protein